MPSDHQEWQRREIRKLNARFRPKGICVLAILISSVLLVGCSSVATNHSPVISALTAEKDKVFPSQPCRITCVASDLDGDSLAYEWGADEGSISGEGPVIDWTAPDAVGTYTITASVSDGNGSRVTRYLSMEVAVNNPPTIKSLDIEETEVIVSTGYSIACVASDQDGDELSYKWSATRGSISGEGPMVTWTAPDAVGTYTITVVVTDSYGSQASDRLDIPVVTANNPPVIGSLIVTNRVGEPVENGKVLKNNHYYIECFASDPDGDKLSYDWWVSDGEILEEKPSKILWLAPNYATQVTVEVTVSDERDAKVDRTIRLEVVTTGCQYYNP